METNQNQSTTGTVVAIIVILAIVVVGAFYFWGAKNENMMTPTKNNETNDSLENIEFELGDFEEITL